MYYNLKDRKASNLRVNSLKTPLRRPSSGVTQSSAGAGSLTAHAPRLQTAEPVPDQPTSYSPFRTWTVTTKHARGCTLTGLKCPREAQMSLKRISPVFSTFSRLLRNDNKISNFQTFICTSCISKNRNSYTKSNS